MKRLYSLAADGRVFVASSDAVGLAHEIDASVLHAGTLITVGLGTSEVHASMDFETYSEAGYRRDHEGKIRGLNSQGKGGLPAVGTPNYAAHPTAEVLCLYYDLKDGKGRRGWYPGAPDPVDLLIHVLRGGTIEGWNVTFEFWIWNMVCVPRYGWPVLTLEQCRCAMAKSRRFSLPGALGSAAGVLGTSGKNKEGTRLIQKLTRPHTPTKNRPAYRWTPATAWPDFLAFYGYCDQDVHAEDSAGALIPDLTPPEFDVWQMDQRINVRGVPVDMAALDAMLDILDQAERKYTAELVEITGGAVTSVSKVAALGDWLRTQGLDLPDMQKDTVADAVNGDTLALYGHNAWRALQIRQTLGAANVKKLRTLRLQVSSDGRLRDQYVYCGADRTGRWSAGGVQLQNITAKGPDSAQCGGCEEYFNPTGRDRCPLCGCTQFVVMPDWTIDAVCAAIRCILTGRLDTVELMWGDPIALLCGCLRGLFMAPDGLDFVCCDFSAIEAVVAACVSRCQWRIEVFSGDGKIYEASASRATGIPLQEILDYKKQNGMHHPARKKVGKVRELAGGYGGWVNAWKNFGADAFMNDDEIKDDVLKWRDESPEIVDMWGGQFRWCGPRKWDYRPELFGLEGAAINAVMHPGQCFGHTDISYGVWDDVLYCRLPSGRFLHYHRPRLAEARDKLNRGPSVQLTFEGHDSATRQWLRQETYGGKLFENVVQAIARDIQAEALLRCEARGYPIVMHTHDEGTAEVPHGFGSVDEMAAIMSERPEWASWWPLRAAGWRHKRYQKD